MKKFGKYLLIVLLLLVGLCAVGGLYLFFVPGAHIFNLQYISLNERIFSEAYSGSNYNKIVLNSYAYDVNVVASDSSDISVILRANNIGFVLNKNSVAKIEPIIEGSTITFNIREVHGATYVGESRIDLRIPKDKAFDLTLNNYKATTNISADIKIDDFTYSTKKGDVSLDKATLNGTLDVTINNATLTFGSELITNSNNVYIDTNSGKFDANGHSLGDVNIDKNVKAVILLGDANLIKMDTTSAGGRIEANVVKHLDIESSDTNVYIKEVASSASVILTASGKVDIERINTAALITTDSGDIKIGSSTSPLTLFSTHGNINVLDTTSSVDATNTYGYINVVFNDDALSYLADTISRKLTAKNENGKITCIGAENVTIYATNNSRVELTMNDVIGTNLVDGSNGSVNIVIPNEASFTLDTASSGKVSVNLTNISNIGTGGYTTGDYLETSVNGSNGTNTLSVNTTNGNLRIRDTITNQLG